MFVYFFYGIKNSVLEQSDHLNATTYYESHNESSEQPNFDSSCLTPNYRPTNIPQNSVNNHHHAAIQSQGQTLPINPVHNTNPFLSSESPDFEMKIPANRYTSI